MQQKGYETVMLFVQHKVGVGLSFCLRIESVCHGGICGSIPNPSITIKSTMKGSIF